MLHINISGGSWVVDSHDWCSGLRYPLGCFYKSKELSEDAYSKFSDIYEDFWRF